jgi:hypothetical protein
MPAYSVNTTPHYFSTQLDFNGPIPDTKQSHTTSIAITNESPHSSVAAPISQSNVHLHSQISE